MYSRDYTPLHQVLQETEHALDVLDASMAVFEARVNANRLPVVWAEHLVNLLTGNAPQQWAFDFDTWKPNTATPYAVIVLRNAVYVWTTNPENGQLADHIGIIQPDTTRADIWRMRQTYARKLAREYGLSGKYHPLASSFHLQDSTHV